MFIRYFFNWCFLFILVNVPLSWSMITCRDHFSSGALIIDFAKSVRGDSFSKNWENQILQSFSNWSQREVESFFNDMSQRISKAEIVKGLREPSFFDQSSYETFKKTVNFYEDYISQENVTKKMKKSMGDFFYSHSFDEIKPVPELLSAYIGKDKVLALMRQDLRAFSMSQMSELKPVVEFLSDYLGGKKEVLILMKRDLRAFSMAQFSTLKQAIESYEGNYGKEKTIAQIQKSLRLFPLTRSFEN